MVKMWNCTLTQNTMYVNCRVKLMEIISQTFLSLQLTSVLNRFCVDTNNSNGFHQRQKLKNKKLK